jgi:hypothetical protein
MGAGLHRRAGHPLCTLRDAIYAYFEAAAPGRFRAFDDLHPIVSTAAVRWGWWSAVVVCIACSAGRFVCVFVLLCSSTAF